MVKILSVVSIGLIVINFITYDAKKVQDAKQEETRTRIIAGIPANDKDYKLVHQPERKDQAQKYF